MEIVQPSREEILARKRRLYTPPGGRVSADLDVLCAPALRRHRIAEQARQHERMIQLRWLKLKKINKWMEGLKPPPPSAPPQVIHRRFFIADVRRAVCAELRITALDLLSHRRTADRARARHIFFYLCRELIKMSYPDIGRRCGGRDHTTVLHSVRKVESLLATDERLAEDIERVRRRILESPQ